MIRVVIDTNILVSALISPRGNEAHLLIAVRESRVKPCLTDEVVDEYVEVLNRSKFNFRVREVADPIALFQSKGQFVHPGAASALSPDPTDTKFLQCASAALADFLVTGNRRHFPASPYGPTYVVSAGELLSQIASKAPLSS